MVARPNALQSLQSLGQSVWLDGVTPNQIVSGEFGRLSDEGGITGFTPGSTACDGTADDSHLTVADVAHAADLLRPVHRRTNGGDGFAGIEVSPHLAHDGDGMIEEARELWHIVRRPNLMIALPGTPAGVKAIRRLVSEGINVAATPLFGLDIYWKVCDAICDGLESRRVAGQPLDGIVTVMGIPLAPVDAIMDSLLAEAVPAAATLRGKVALAAARFIYHDTRSILGGKRWASVLSHGAQAPRLLWTALGNGAEVPAKYVEPLVGPNTICAMTPDTLATYRAYGCPAPSLHRNFADAEDVMSGLGRFDIDLENVATRLRDRALAAALTALNAESAASGWNNLLRRQLPGSP